MSKISIFQSLVFLFHLLILRVRGYCNPKPKYQKYLSSLLQSDLSGDTLIFNVEEALLISDSLFPYFMLVAFEAGGVIRSFILFILYPLIITFLSHEMGIKVMLMVSFFGVNKKRFRAGRAVLPKHFLEDVGLEMFQVLKKGGKRIGVSYDLPQVMIEGFLRDYLEIEVVVGREMKVVCGYYLGIMEDKTKHDLVFDELVRKERLNNSRLIGITSFNTSLHRYDLFSQFCQEIYYVKKSEKRIWQTLPRNQYPKPLIFHDGRLAIKPTLINTLVLFMWGPFAATIALARLVVSLCIPYSLSIPILVFSGCRLTVKHDNVSSQKSKSQRKSCLYVCNHRTLLDPLYLAFSLKKKNIKTVTYSISRVSEILAPIKTVRLTRNRISDGHAMRKLLTEGYLVVCPEGTTCREPYLLRFSPLFTEVSDVIVPVAVESHMTFFYGTTASGLKAFDPLFFLMDPFPSYTVRFLDSVAGAKCRDLEGKLKFEVANHVQSEIGKALDYESTNLTRKDKYLILAGNNGVVNKN